MTTYNTGNPVPSADARDLYDNAENLDAAVNSTDPEWTDRTGTVRPTLKRLEDDFPNAGVDADSAADCGASAAACAVSASSAAASARSASAPAFGY